MKWIITTVILAVLLPLTLQRQNPAHAVEQINNPIQVTKPKEEAKAVPTPTAQAPSQSANVEVQPQTPVIYHSDDFYKEFIFSHESFNRLDTVNSIGCYGLGQSCSDALRDACPNWQTDLACQLGFWDRYASAYGGWEQSYIFWNCKGFCYSARIDQIVKKDSTWW